MKKFFKKLFVAIAALFLVSSAVVLVAEADHNCTHEDCQICEVIRVAEETSKHTIKEPPVKVVSLIIPALFAFVACISFTEKNNIFHTPISLKNKLSN
jgi:uncharacterized membrane protein YkvI